MNSVLPSLSDEGFISNKEVIIAKLFKYFLASNYSQSNTFYEKAVHSVNFTKISVRL
jgi:hypothetical protein